MKKQSLLVVLVIVYLSLSSCGKEEPKHTDKPKVAVYTAAHIRKGNLSASVQLPGVLKPFQEVQVFPKVNGFVKNILVDRGSMVKKGQVLLSLEAPELQQDVAAAYGRYTQARANYLNDKNRYERLLITSATPGTVSAYDLQAANAKMQADSASEQGEFADYKAKESLKGYLTITAAFDGIITERNVHPGALVGPGAQNAMPMLVLQELSKLRLVTEVPEEFAGQVKEGTHVIFRVNALPGEQFNAVVSRGSGSLSNKYRTETMEIDVDNTNKTFKPGMYAEVILPACGNTRAYVVPKSAIVTTTEKKYIITMPNGIAKFTDIKEGNANSDSVEVFGNLQDMDIIVSNADYHIRDGEKIEISK